MKKECEEIQLIGAYLDGELSPSEVERIRTHLQHCVVCSKELEQLKHLESSLKMAVELKAGRLAVEPFWHEVRRRIVARKPWYEALWDWAALGFYRPRLTWGIPLVIMGLLAGLSLEQFVPGWRLVPHRNNVAAVDSIDSHGLNVAVFRESKTKTTVIWLFQNQEENNETSQEPEAGRTF